MTAGIEVSSPGTASKVNALSNSRRESLFLDGFILRFSEYGKEYTTKLSIARKRPEAKVISKGEWSSVNN
jgi:hypothetical protein